MTPLTLTRCLLLESHILSLIAMTPKRSLWWEIRRESKARATKLKSDWSRPAGGAVSLAWMRFSTEPVHGFQETFYLLYKLTVQNYLKTVFERAKSFLKKSSNIHMQKKKVYKNSIHCTPLAPAKKTLFFIKTNKQKKIYQPFNQCSFSTLVTVFLPTLSVFFAVSVLLQASLSG